MSNINKPEVNDSGISSHIWMKSCSENSAQENVLELGPVLIVWKSIQGN